MNLDLLETNKFTLLDLEHQLSFDLVSFASLTWALNQWRESLGVNDLVHLISASVTCVICDLNAWFHITASGHDTFAYDQGSNGVGFDLSHFDKLFFSVSTWNDAEMVSSLKLWRDSKFCFIGTAGLLVGSALCDGGMVGLYRIKSSLLHHNIEGRVLII